MKETAVCKLCRRCKKLKQISAFRKVINIYVPMIGTTDKLYVGRRGMCYECEKIVDKLRKAKKRKLK